MRVGQPQPRVHQVRHEPSRFRRFSVRLPCFDRTTDVPFLPVPRWSVAIPLAALSNGLRTPAASALAVEAAHSFPSTALAVLAAR